MSEKADWARYAGPKELARLEDFKESSIYEKNQTAIRKNKFYNTGGKDYFSMVALGEYRVLFEELGKYLKKSPTLYEYHLLYINILESITSILFNSIGNMILGKSFEEEDSLIIGSAARYESISKDIYISYQKEKLKLDIIFNEYAATAEKNKTEKSLEELKKEMGEIKKYVSSFNKPQGKTMTEYDRALLENGSIDEDFNAIHSAPEIADFLVWKFKMDDLKPEIIQRYKHNGKPFTINTARKAVGLAKS